MNSKSDDEEGISKLEGIATIITKNAAHSDKETVRWKQGAWEDGRGGSWAYLFPGTHQGHNYIWSTHSENNLMTSETALAGHSWRYKGKKNHIEKGKKGRDMVGNKITVWWPTVGRTSRVPLEEWGIRPHIGYPPPWGSVPGRWAPIIFGFETQWGLTLGELEGYRKLGLCY